MDNDALVKAAFDFIISLKELPLPKGQIEDSFDYIVNKKTGKIFKTGFSVVLKGLGAFIQQNLDTVSDVNQTLIERLENKDGLASILSDIALNPSPDALQDKENLLRAALMIKGETIFDRIISAVKTVAREKQLQLEENRRQARGDKDSGPPSDAKDKREQQKDEGTWRESLHKTDKPPISNDDIAKSANEFNQSYGSDEKEIKRSAQDGPGEFIPGDEHRNDYERQENSGAGDMNYFKDQQRLKQEIQGYYSRAMMLAEEFGRTLGPLLGEKESGRMHG